MAVLVQIFVGIALVPPLPGHLFVCNYLLVQLLFLRAIAGSSALYFFGNSRNGINSCLNLTSQLIDEWNRNYSSDPVGLVDVLLENHLVLEPFFHLFNALAELSHFYFSTHLYKLQGCWLDKILGSNLNVLNQLDYAVYDIYRLVRAALADIVQASRRFFEKVVQKGGRKLFYRVLTKEAIEKDQSSEESHIDSFLLESTRVQFQKIKQVNPLGVYPKPKVPQSLS